MSETFELTTTTPSAHSLVSENGKKYYYLNVRQSPPADPFTESQGSQSFGSQGSYSQELEPKFDPHRETSHIVDSEPLNYDDHINKIHEEKSGPIHYYGATMVVKNAREMFNNVDILPDGRYYCNVCKRPYKTHATLTAHVRGCHLRQESACTEPNCNYVSYTENERRKHQKVHDKAKYSSYSRDALRMHRKMENIITPLFPSENNLRRTTIQNNKEVVGMFSSFDKRGRVKYSCSKCDQCFHNAYYATRHMEIHSDAQKQCFYCGEIRQGTMDLHVHYMRFHKNEGIRTITCKACESVFTTTTLFRNHAMKEECELAVQNSRIQQDIYYGELPDGTVIDNATLNRLNFFRKRQDEREQMKSVTVEMGGVKKEIVQQPEQNGKEPPAAGSSSHDSEIFDDSNSLIQTEFGLKNLAEFKTTRAVKREIDDGNDNEFDSIKKERVLMAQNGYYSNHQQQQHYPMTTQSQQQQNDWSSNFVYPPPTYGYDPLIGTYPDFQPTQQALGLRSYVPYQNAFYPPMSSVNDLPYIKQEIVTSDVKHGEDGNFGPYQTHDPLKQASEIASDFLVNEQRDVVFEELNKLDFVMPTDTENDNDDDDLDGIFNFSAV
ncbi:hypothetical protein GCK72_009330 [Caenorhabditis remanei]|uniref:C2H2-type domain-containing protein n=1 Tax=Caenorhabditis remanei TaxID=31234 RepID=A0A6A5H2M1_CAERE|nr:hypothetical protein GCK72_009330 [Caenorhabditis remanei]KAF1761076.1 hypothetical protein GCK72_009330 [Caenorhabditis remanei]